MHLSVVCSHVLTTAAETDPGYAPAGTHVRSTSGQYEEARRDDSDTELCEREDLSLR